ncbi:MAG: FtsX-like permease family protein, partial [Flavihumibacter sp.]
NQPVKSLDNIAVGIIDDIHNLSFKEKIAPTVIYCSENTSYGNILVKVLPGKEQQVIAGINKTWNRFFPDRYLDMRWTDETLKEQYRQESKLQQLFSFFSILSIVLAAIGILGLISFAAQRRTKEIGIRKVLGASALTITRLLSADYILLVLLSLLIAGPVAWWLMNRWLQDYAYRVKIDAPVFLVAAGITGAITLLTISYQVIKASFANPVDSLRSE